MGWKRTLALIAQQVTIPAFLFTTIVNCNQNWSDLPCPDITNDLKDIWLLLFWPGFVVICGLGVGHLAAKVANTPKEQYCSVLAACAFGNATALPITILSVIHANFSPVQQLGAIDPTLFLSVYLLLYPVLQWSIGGYLLAPEDNSEKSKDTLVTKSNGYETLKDVAIPDQEKAQPSTYFSNIPNVLNNKSAQTFYKTLRRGLSSTDASLYISNRDLMCMAESSTDREQEIMANTISAALKSPDSSLRLSLTQIPESTNFSEEKLSLNQVSESTHKFNSEETHLLKDNEGKVSFGTDDTDSDSSGTSNASDATTKADENSLYDTISKILSRCLQPPVLAALVGLFVASTRLRGILVDLKHRADAAPLEWIFDALYSVGQAAVPINMLILGCNLSASSLATQSSDGKSKLLSNQTMIAIVVGKMIVMPIIGVISCFFLKCLYPLSKTIDEAFYLVCMIVFITPTANNVMVMVELSGSGTKEGIARVIGWQYAVAPVLLSLSVTASVGMALLLDQME